MLFHVYSFINLFTCFSVSPGTLDYEAQDYGLLNLYDRMTLLLYNGAWTVHRDCPLKNGLSELACLRSKAYLLILPTTRRCPWCNAYHRRKWTWGYKFKSWTRLVAFHIAQYPWERYESDYSPSSYG